MKFFLVFAAASSFILYIYFCLPSTPVRHPLKKEEENWSVAGILHPSILLCSRASHTLWSAVVAWQKNKQERVAHFFWQGLLGIV